MDNNKFVDKLNFIKIYFKVFIYKIIVLDKPKLSRKEIKKKKKSWTEDENMSRCKNRIKKPQKESPNGTWTWKSVWHSKAPLDNFGVQNWHLLGFGPMAFGWWYRFWSFRRRMSHDSYSTLRDYFLEFSGLYK